MLTQFSLFIVAPFIAIYCQCFYYRIFLTDIPIHHNECPAIPPLLKPYNIRDPVANDLTKLGCNTLFCIHKWLPQQCFCLWRNSSEQHCETSPWHFTHSPSAFPLPLMFSHQALTSSTQCVDIWNVTARLHLQCESRSKPKVQQL